MSVWTMLENLWGNMYEALSPVFNYRFGGFTYWQYGLFAFLAVCFIRFVLPLVSGGHIAPGALDEADEVKKGDPKTNGKG